MYRGNSSSIISGDCPLIVSYASIGLYFFMFLSEIRCFPLRSDLFANNNVFDVIFGIVFDFECVKFFSSQVLGLLLDIRSKLMTLGGELVISAIDPQLFRVFKITNLDKIFKFYPDKDSAVKAFSEV